MLVVRHLCFQILKDSEMIELRNDRTAMRKRVNGWQWVMNTVQNYPLTTWAYNYYKNILQAVFWPVDPSWYPGRDDDTFFKEWSNHPRCAPSVNPIPSTTISQRDAHSQGITIHNTNITIHNTNSLQSLEDSDVVELSEERTKVRATKDPKKWPLDMSKTQLHAEAPEFVPKSYLSQPQTTGRQTLEFVPPSVAASVGGSSGASACGCVDACSCHGSVSLQSSSIHIETPEDSNLNQPKATEGHILNPYATVFVPRGVVASVGGSSDVSACGCMLL